MRFSIALSGPAGRLAPPEDALEVRRHRTATVRERPATQSKAGRPLTLAVLCPE
jgi:hypothetical protein